MKKMMLLFLVAFVFLLSSCNRVLYYGRTYPATTDVEIYFRESDVKQPHEIMGKVVYEVTAKRKSEKVQEKLLRKSRQHGADAIIFDDISLTRTGSNTTGAGGGAGLKRGFLGIFGARTRYAKGQLVKGTLLKYQK